MSEKQRYRVYLSDVSYFSGKLEGALRAKRIAYERVRITPDILLREVLPNTGWMKVPALRRDDGLWLCDSTPLLRWLDAENPQRALIPDDPYRAFLSALIEDYCDEWQWRPAMFWRWAWPDNARYLGARLGAELSAGTPHPAWAMGLYFRKRQQRIYLRGDGVRASNFEAIAALYPRALGWLENLLEHRRYLLGDRPSLVDIAWFGPMFRHYAQDPRPAALMAATAPRVWAWVTRLWNSGAEDWSETALDDFSDAAWTPIFNDLGRAYLPYLQDNAAALAAGARHFDGHYGGIDYPRLPAIRYRARCLATLRQSYALLAPGTRARVDARLQGLGISECLAAAPILPEAAVIDSALAGPRRDLSLAQRLRFYFSGTPWDSPP
ncbi:glutathione S-transferase family protein [Stagnimonas aquatica]|uniref:Glutathione S-transferase family protein n=1 Tax=Stagnimonas aquatica TaxID=2689987 RepID=A0A3N0V208_9GAMM|nr:glutathione S-transferase family protein [Stagnimonas aquatica]ROH86508.1 glutathione S-transferase family protein [Stagnimonas aquatica]